MKKIFVLLAVILVSTLIVSGCVQQPPQGGGLPTGQVTQKQAEQQAMNELENEIEQATANVTLEDIENALLQQ
jgi:outer membrane murein-binding lipoprotein Lpp